MTEESGNNNDEVLTDLSTSDELCGICGDPLYTKYSISLPCNHNYHYECINDSCLLAKKNGSQSCPYCGYNFKTLTPVNGLKKLNMEFIGILKQIHQLKQYHFFQMDLKQCLIIAIKMQVVQVMYTWHLVHQHLLNMQMRYRRR